MIEGSTLRHKLLHIAAIAVALLQPQSGLSQAWKPEKPVEIIVSASPGGGVDRTARILQNLMQDKQLVPVPVTVVNKPGAGGALGLNYLLQHGGSPYHLMMGSATELTAHIMGRTKTAPADVQPLAMLYTDYMMLATRPDSPIRSGKDLVERLKKDPQSATITVGVGLGNMNHIAAALPLKMAGVDVSKLKVVVFKSIGEGVAAVLGGHVDVVSATAAILLPHIEGGKLRVIATASPARLGGAFANVPTWKDQGIDANVALFQYVMANKGLTPAQLTYWENVVGSAVATDDWKKMLTKFYLTDAYMRSADTRKYLDAQYAQLRSILTDLALAKTAN